MTRVQDRTILPTDLAAQMACLDRRLGPFARQIHHHREVGSTSDVLATLAREGAPHGTVVVADMQTAGRGRHGNSWFSPSGSGLYLSVLLRTVASPMLTLAAGVAIAEALRAATGIAATLEWPNDVVVVHDRDVRKVAGILAEATNDAELGDRVILGVGVNLKDTAFPPELADRAGSVEGVSGRQVDATVVLGELLAALSSRCAQVEAGAKIELLARWESLAPMCRDTTVEWSVGDRRHRGVTEGVDEEGRLLVRVGAQQQRLSGGEVRRVRGYPIRR